ncbi:hypothetical protein [uncultured Sunxiuqinia sp.]|uniref:hypothetical protein n=1 Tax=uncultured Sunxiuqinia sp. TaxID=1573825 RepID=UPI0030D7A520|tara:strand:+ start:22 stop:900 length:879 start_codon:yes stop_codon:yes gene_type:complete
MKQITIILSLLSIVITTNSYCQETKVKRVQKGDYIEEYYVLKENKSIKHGEYVKFQKYILDRRIPIAFGFFENDRKVGEWYFFHNGGALESFGNYFADEKRGVWKEYYKPLYKDISLSSLVNGQSDLTIDEKGSVIVSKKDSLIAAMGIYNSGDKMGTWNYYDGRGTLIHVFDHSSDKMIFSSASDSTNRCCPYLGGTDRFYSYYFRFAEASGFNNTLTDAKVILKLGIDGALLTIERINSNGAAKATFEFERLIQLFPNDWIPSYFDNPVFLTLEHKTDSNKLSVSATFSQ